MGKKLYLEEEILEYEQHQLDAWKAGDHSLIPEFLDIYSDYKNQPSDHFGEIFVLDHYSRHYGWKGFRFYALGTWEADNSKYDKSRRKIGELFSKDQMIRFWASRTQEDKRSGIGEPDLMLFNDEGKVLFIEVKKGPDQASDEQLRCLAQIKAILNADVKIVYLKVKNKLYTPKKYELDLETYSFKKI